MSDSEAESAVEVRVEEVIQLFDTLDPFPFRERDLDRDAEEYIVSWAREFPRNHSLRIIIHAPASEVHGTPHESSRRRLAGISATVLRRLTVTSVICFGLADSLSE